MLIDTSALIAYFEETDAVADAARSVIDGAVRSGRNRAVVSAVSVMELLVRPLRSGLPETYRGIVEFLTRFPGIGIQDVTFAVAREAAWLRASNGLDPADALIVASGIVAGTRHVLTNDRAWARRLAPIADRLAVHYLGAVARG